MRPLLRAVAFVWVGLGVPTVFVDTLIVDMVRVFGVRIAWTYAACVVLTNGLCTAVLIYPESRRRLVRAGLPGKVGLVGLFVMWLLLVGGICIRIRGHL